MPRVIRPGLAYRYKGSEDYDEDGFVSGSYYQLKEIVGKGKAVFVRPLDGIDIDFPYQEFFEYWE